MLTSLDDRNDHAQRYFVFPQKRASLTSSSRTQTQAQVHVTPPPSAGFADNMVPPQPAMLNTRSVYSGDASRRPSLTHWRTVREVAHPLHSNTLAVHEPLSRHARSFDTARSWRGAGQGSGWHNSRKVFSYEEDFVQQRGRKHQQQQRHQLSPQFEHDRLHITEFVKLPLNAPHYMHTSGSPPPHSPARYNDMGSFEELSEEVIDGIVEDYSASRSELGVARVSDSTKLWQLRSTFEEEDELSDSIHVHDSPSTDPDDVSANENAQVHPPPAINTVNLRQGAPVPAAAQPLYDVHVSKEVTSRYTVRLTSKQDDLITSSSHGVTQLHPSHSTCHYSTQRRDNFRNMLQRRSDASFLAVTSAVQRRQQTNETSLDSFENMETDGDASESSRYEVTTTSFESSTTTENTDSTGDSASHKLQQMRNDSGYKSIESTQQPQLHTTTTTLSCAPASSHLQPLEGGKQARRLPRLVKAATIGEAEARRAPVAPQRLYSSAQTSVMYHQQQRDVEAGAMGPSRSDPHRASHYHDRRSSRTASKKRRDFRSPRSHLQQPDVESQRHFIGPSVPEVESDSATEPPASGDSFENQQSDVRGDAAVKPKAKASASVRRQLTMGRDFSIDERSSAIFNDFLRHDDKFDRKSPNSHARRRVERKNTDVTVSVVSRRDRYRRCGSRNATIDGVTSAFAATFHKISPEDSIEEEDEEVWQQQENKHNTTAASTNPTNTDATSQQPPLSPEHPARSQLL